MQLKSNNNPELNILPGNLIKPDIVSIHNDFPVFLAGMNYRNTLRLLQQNKGIIVEGSYPTAIAFYTWLKKRITEKHPVTDYISSRKTKNIINKTTKKIFLKIKHHRITLSKSPENPFLKELYPDKEDFLITLPDILGMNGAWQWYKKGVSYPVLEQKLHPFYGVYFPTRIEHLIMFDRWMEYNKHKFNNAIDIGTGCGILSFIMAKHGVKKIYATDINPNSVSSIMGDANRLGLASIIIPECNSLFGSEKNKGDLTVFNPPWLPGKCENFMDRGVYYDDPLFFQYFFDRAETRIFSGSTLALIFSDFAVKAGLTKDNPIEKELSRRKTFILEEKLTKKTAEKTGHHSKTWLGQIREKEKTELWILKKS